jgi:solute:Na+ symporter, SSS family
VTPIDYLVIVVYFVGVFLIGARFARQQTSLKDFFLGSRNVPWWAATFSGIATIVSGVSFLGGPGLAFSLNYSFHQFRLGIPIALLVLCVVMLPILFRLNVYSIYEYLEMRFDRRTRRLASVMFILMKCGYLSVVIYAPSIVLAEMTGWSLAGIIVVTGMITTVYTLLGGIKAVIWTDTMQLGVLLTGIVVTLVIITRSVDGGLARVWETADAAGRLDFWNFSFSPMETYTVWAGLIGGAFMLIGQWGSDQAELQRFLSTKSVSMAQRALVVSLLAATVVGVAQFFIGTSLFAFYTEFQDRGGLQTEPNRIFAKFIIEEIPTVFKGGLIAAVLAASMSTISSVLNSLATVALREFSWADRQDRPAVKQARWLTLVFGVLTTAVGLAAGNLGNLLEAATRVINLFGGSLSGVFLLGMLSRRATAGGGFYGALAGLLAALWLNFFTQVSFLWFGPVAAATAFGIGLLVSALDSRGPPSAASGDLVFNLRRLGPSPAALVKEYTV